MIDIKNFNLKSRLLSTDEEINTQMVDARIKSSALKVEAEVAKVEEQLISGAINLEESFVRFAQNNISLATVLEDWIDMKHLEKKHEMLKEMLEGEFFKTEDETDKKKK